MKTTVQSWWIQEGWWLFSGWSVIWIMLFAAHTFSAPALRGLRHSSHKSKLQWDEQTCLTNCLIQGRPERANDEKPYKMYCNFHKPEKNRDSASRNIDELRKWSKCSLVFSIAFSLVFHLVFSLVFSIVSSCIFSDVLSGVLTSGLSEWFLECAQSVLWVCWSMEAWKLKFAKGFSAHIHCHMF